jgi:hypothetical protein
MLATNKTRQYCSTIYPMLLIVQHVAYRQGRTAAKPVQTDRQTARHEMRQKNLFSVVAAF